jgi:SAM-dependent methyltransferase
MDLDALPNVTVVSQLERDHRGYSLEDGAAMAALSRAEDRHFWHRTRNLFIQRRLTRLGVSPGARVLELGCGGGSVAAHLSSAGYVVTGIDGHLARVTEAARRAPDAAFIVHDLAQGLPPSVGSGYDGVGLFDVIEHLDEPREALQSALAVVRVGGALVGTVPANMSLWSEVDRAAGHRLRYDAGTLRSVLGAVPGAEVLEVVPFNRSLVPMLWLQRRCTRRDDPGALARSLRVPGPPWNEALAILLRIEYALSGVLDRLPVGGASLWFALRRSR